jgi:hypothetical protein
MLWEIATGLNDEYSVLVPLGDDMECAKIFQITGKPIKWQTPPKVAPFIAPRRKIQKKRADIEYLLWGAIVLNGRAYQALHDALAPFGEFLPLGCMGEVLHFYNVTTLHSVIDYDSSGKTGKCVTKPVFILVRTYCALSAPPPSCCPRPPRPIAALSVRPPRPSDAAVRF